MALSKVQKVTLAVGVPLTVAAIGWGGLNAVAAVGRGSEHISEQIPISDGKLSFHLGSGSIQVQSGPASTASLVGTVNYSLIRPTVNLSNDQNGTSAGFSCTLIVGWCDAQTTLSLPASVTSARLSTDEGDISAADVPVSLENLTLSTSMGSITATGVTAQDVSAHSSMGDITLTFTTPPRSLSVTDSMGDIHIILPPGSYNITDASSDMGNATDDFRPDPTSTHVISAHSAMGDVSISKS